MVLYFVHVYYLDYVIQPLKRSVLESHLNLLLVSFEILRNVRLVEEFCESSFNTPCSLFQDVI